MNELIKKSAKCSRCGLCQANCPAFKETGLESSGAKGKLIALENTKSKNIEKVFNNCLLCSACKSFCPAGIETNNIIASAKGKLKPLPLIKKIAVRLLENSPFMKLAGVVAKLIPLYPVSYQTKEYIKYKKLAQKKNLGLKVLYYRGCLGNVNKSAYSAARMVFDANGIEHQTLNKQICCGMPRFSSGDMEEFVRLAKKNLDSINELDFDYFITDCASCGSAFELYETLLTGNYQEKARLINKKSININALLDEIDYFVPDILRRKRVGFHSPCHITYGDGSQDKIISFIKKIADYKKLENEESCCGAGGTFCVENYNLAKKIGKKKALTTINSDIDALLTSCPACKAWISYVCFLEGKKIPILQPVELLAKGYLLL